MLHMYTRGNTIFTFSFFLILGVVLMYEIDTNNFEYVQQTVRDKVGFFLTMSR